MNTDTTEISEPTEKQKLRRALFDMLDLLDSEAGRLDSEAGRLVYEVEMSNGERRRAAIADLPARLLEAGGSIVSARLI